MLMSEKCEMDEVMKGRDFFMILNIIFVQYDENNMSEVRNFWK